MSDDPIVSVERIMDVAATMGDDIKAFRSSAVTSENKEAVSSRSILAALVSGSCTKTLATSAILHAFGNPKLPSGKPLENLSGSGDHLPGFGAVRKMAATVFDIFENIDVDAPRETEDGGTIGAGKVRALVVGYILGDADAPKRLNGLKKAVRAAIGEHVKATSPDNADATADNAEGDDSAAPFDAADAIAKLTVWASTMSAEQQAAVGDAFNALYEAFDARTNALLAETAPVANAA